MSSILSRLLQIFSTDIAMDLGTANTLLYTRKRGIIINEPSVVALDARDNSIMAIGARAREFIGRTPAGIKAVRPLKDGVIADFDVTRAMISTFCQKDDHRSQDSKARHGHLHPLRNHPGGKKGRH